MDTFFYNKIKKQNAITSPTGDRLVLKAETQRQRMYGGRVGRFNINFFL